MNQEQPLADVLAKGKHLSSVPYECLDILWFFEIYVVP